MGPLHAIACLLLLEGQHDEATYPRMIKEACFPRLLELIHERREEDPQLHRLLLELMYEMSRVERLRAEDLMIVDDGFIHYLFRLIEEVFDDVHDPYHYPTIRVLVCTRWALIARHSIDVVTARFERTVYAGIDRYSYRSFIPHDAIDKSDCQVPESLWAIVPDVRGEHYITSEPRDRNVVAAVDTEAAIPSLYNEGNLRILLYE